MKFQVSSYVLWKETNRISGTSDFELHVLSKMLIETPHLKPSFKFSSFDEQLAIMYFMYYFSNLFKIQILVIIKTTLISFVVTF